MDHEADGMKKTRQDDFYHEKSKVGQSLYTLNRKLVTIKLQCNNTALLSLFKEIKHLESNCRENIKVIASECLVKKKSHRELIR